MTSQKDIDTMTMDEYDAWAEGRRDYWFGVLMPVLPVLLGRKKKPRKHALATIADLVENFPDYAILMTVVGDFTRHVVMEATPIGEDRVGRMHGYFGFNATYLDGSPVDGDVLLPLQFLAACINRDAENATAVMATVIETQDRALIQDFYEGTWEAVRQIARAVHEGVSIPVVVDD